MDEERKVSLMLADWMLVAQLLLAAVGMALALMAGSPLLALVVGLLFGCGLVVFLEWRSSL